MVVADGTQRQSFGQFERAEVRRVGTRPTSSGSSAHRLIYGNEVVVLDVGKLSCQSVSDVTAVLRKCRWLGMMCAKYASELERAGSRASPS